MESENKLLDQILKDAKEEAKIIVKEAQRSAAIIMEKQRQSARQSAEKEAYSILKRAENEAEIIKGKVATDIKRKANWIVVSEKGRMVESVLNEAKNRLVNLKKTEYLSFLEKLIIDAGIVLGGGMLEVILNEKDSSLPLKINKLEKKITDRTGLKTRLKISKKQSKALGAIVKIVDGKIFVDNTYDAIFDRHERELKSKIARILFSSE